ncbi:hypothetical protein CEXT_261431, partial [Caerostris extrusa]
MESIESSSILKSFSKSQPETHLYTYILSSTPVKLGLIEVEITLI